MLQNCAYLPLVLQFNFVENESFFKDINLAGGIFITSPRAHVNEIQIHFRYTKDINKDTNFVYLITHFFKLLGCTADKLSS